MSPDRKRGVPFPDGFVTREARETGPFPPWEATLKNLQREFGPLENNSIDGLRMMYLRRVWVGQQILDGKSKKDGFDPVDEMLQAGEEVKEKYPDFFESKTNIDILVGLNKKIQDQIKRMIAKSGGGRVRIIR